VVIASSCYRWPYDGKCGSSMAPATVPNEHSNGDASRFEKLGRSLLGWPGSLGSWCCVQPVVARLHMKHSVVIEPGDAPHVEIVPILRPLGNHPRLGALPGHLITTSDDENR
jgi:hypothetical protein